MRFIIQKNVFNYLCELIGFEKSTSHKTEKIRKLVTINPSKGKSYQAYRWVNIVTGKASKIDRHYDNLYAKEKAKYNTKVIVNKNFRDLNEKEINDFISKSEKIKF